jgi:hypothetical protein
VGTAKIHLVHDFHGLPQMRRFLGAFSFRGHDFYLS